MRVVKPAFMIEEDLMFEELGVTPEQYSRAYLRMIEKLTRRCYKSEGKQTEDSYKEFVPRVYNAKKHEGIVEHRVVTVCIFSDRGVSHELVRHRIASYLQESTRYVNYERRGMTVILPPWLDLGDKYVMPMATRTWLESMRRAEDDYNNLLSMGWTPQEARGVLPQALKAEVGATMNLRSWYNCFFLRTPANAHPQIRQIMCPLLKEFQKRFPGIFDDIEVPELDYEPATMIRHERELVEVL